MSVVERNSIGAMWIAVIVFLLFKSSLILSSYLPLWDEAVYLSMGKYVLSWGEIGMWETLRPPMLPLILAGFQFLGNPIVLGTIFIQLVAIIGPILLYQILKREVHPYIAAGIASVLLFSDVWVQWSNHILTGVFSATLIVIACYFAYKDKPILAGLFAAFAFLTRFPAGIVLPSIGIWYVIHLFLRSKHAWKNITSYCIAALIPIGGWLFTNWFRWHAETSTWWHATFRPLLFGATNVFYQNNWLYDVSFTYYFHNLLLTIPIILFAIAGLVHVRKHLRLLPLALTGILGLAFFTWLDHNEWRFILIALPGLLTLVALGCNMLAQSKLPQAKSVATIFISAVVATQLVAAGEIMKPASSTALADIVPFYEFLQRQPVSGTVIVNDPVAAWYVPNKVVPIYYEHLPKFRGQLAQEHDAVIFAPHAFPCPPDSDQCRADLKEVVDRLTTTEKLIHQTQWLGNDYYIFSTKRWYSGLPVDTLREKYGLGQTMTLSPHPYDRLPVVLVLEDFPSLNEEKSDIWEVAAYYETLDIFAAVPTTIAVIPTHLSRIESLYPGTVEELQSFEIAQNGNDHTSVITHEDQVAHIQEGKETITTLFGRSPTVFIPPFYAANKQTINAIETLDYETYISTTGDSTVTNLARLDQTNTLILNWDQKILKDGAAVQKDLDRLARYGDYALVSLYYFMYAEQKDRLREVGEMLKTYSLVRPDEAALWIAQKQAIAFTVDGTQITVRAPADTQGITLLARQSGTYTINTNVPISIKNTMDVPLEICLDICETIEPGHFLSKSPMVSAPPPDLVGV